MNVVFRVDFSSQIGLGHLVRCLTLADALKKLDIKSYFLCREHENLDLVSQSGHALISLQQPAKTEVIGDSEYASWLGVSWQEDAEETINAIKYLSPGWLIVDHYAIDFRWQAKLREHVDKIIIIDDLMNRQHDCDLIIDSNYGRTAGDYSGLVPANARICVGSKFVMLRPEFLQYRQAAKTRRLQMEKIETILVFLGGGDPDNVTQIALVALAQLPWEDNPTIVVVLGAANPHVDTIKKYLASYPFKSALHVNTPDMAEFMCSADLAIGASGGTTWERCCLGLPSISVSIAENQRYANQVLCKAGMITMPDTDLPLGEGIIKTVEQLKSNSDLMHSMSQKCFALIDGKGVSRIIQVMKELEQ